ncbi:multidrug resistance protein MdtO [Rhodoblastus acidophilus]|uniref:FUSC family protein n=1 Tax=Rhodoblastus acidophilus TaxID=1074 RepID=UPI002224B374|nr:FUSC family protein [Rhodoblastus acidophilus]MCW2286795.1 multidrug resistance protein MdtO [Rhodoblastus acidophilus]MCW2335648.1 multidrug resistance protein MdtO [Rhodoblastus acidophilus]
MFGPALIADMLAPFDGRLARAAEIAFVVMLVTIVSMAYRIPEPAISVYLIFFVAKENSGLNIVMSLALIVVVTLVVALAIGLAILTINAPEARVVVLACVAFVSFFLGASSKLAPLASTIGLVIAYVLDLLGSAPLGEIALRGLLYAWLFAVMPMLVFIVHNVFFGRHPETLARRAVAARLRLAGRVLQEGEEAALAALRAELETGDAEREERLRMVKLWRRLPSATIERLGALSGLSYGLVMTVVAARTLKLPPATPDALSARLEVLAHRIERLPRVIQPCDIEETGAAPPKNLLDQIEALTSRMETIVAGGPVGLETAEPEGKKEKSGFFVADAFSNPVYARFALKGAAAAMICYLTYTLLDWPGIHTAMLTCFIVSLTTVGETVQKLFLRISGCLAGAVIGTLSMVYILPGTTSITSLVVLVGLVTFPAAWIGVGKPTVSYIGFQLALAFFMCVLQGAEPKFDLSVAQDRTIGIVLGDLVVYVIFTRVFPVSTLGQLRLDLDRLLEQCREVLKTKTAFAPAIGATEEVGRAFATLEAVSGALAAYGYEMIRSGNNLMLGRANRLATRALKNLVRAVGVVAAFPPPAGGDVENPEALRHLYAQADSRLRKLRAGLAAPSDVAFVEVAAEMTPPLAPDGAHAPQIGALEALMTRLNQVQLTLFHYRRLLQPKAGAYE